MKKALKITAALIGLLFIVLLILPFAFQSKIAGIVKSEGNKMLQAQFDFASLDISLLKNFPKASISLNDFWIKGIGEFENDTLAQAQQITVAVNLFSLFGDSGYEVSKILVEDARIKAIALSTQKVNWDVMKPSAEDETTTASSPFKVQLKSVVLKHLDVFYEDREAKMSADIRNLNAQLSGNLTDSQTTLEIETDAEALTFSMDGTAMLNKAAVSAKMDIDADLANSVFTLKENEFRLNAIQFGVDGQVALKENDAMEMDLKLNANQVGFKEILSLIPAIYAKEFASLKADGKVTLDASVKGTMQGDNLPAFNLLAEVKDASFRYPSLPGGVDQINIRADIKNPGGSADLTEININPFSFRLADNPFNLTAAVKTPVSDPDFKVEAKGTLNLGMIEKIYPLDEGIKLNGIVKADMQMAGRLSYIEKEQYDRVNASGSVALSDMKLNMKDMPETQIHQSLLTFSPQYLQLSQTTANIGKNDITVTGRLENYMGYALKDQTLKGALNLQSNRFNLSDFMTQPADTTSTAPTTEGIIEIPANVDLQMEAGMKELLFDNMSFTDVKGTLLIKDAKADIKTLSMNTMGGNAVMNGYYSTADVKKPEMNAAFRLTNIGFAQAYKDLNMVRKLAPIFENLKGSFSGNMILSSKLDSQMSPIPNTVQGEGKLSTQNISLSEIKALTQIIALTGKSESVNLDVKDLAIDFNIKDGRVFTKPFDIKAAGYNMNLSGSTGLDQSIDYTGKVKLPASSGILAQATIDLKIGGMFSSPKVSLDTKSMASQATDAIKNTAAQQIGKQLGLDSAVVANKDSLTKKATEQVTKKALDFLKKKIK